MANEFLAGRRSGRNVRHQLVALLRQSVYSRLAGYPDTNDADRLSRHARLLVLQVAEVAVPRGLLAQVLSGGRPLPPVPT